MSHLKLREILASLVATGINPRAYIACMMLARPVSGRRDPKLFDGKEGRQS